MGFISSPDIEALAKRLKPFIRKTPLESGLGPFKDLQLKREDLQLTNSFTVRAALGILLGLSEQQKRKGLILTTPGNLGWGLAYGLQCLDLKMRLFIVIPEDAVEAKRLGLLQVTHPSITVIQNGLGETERYEIVQEIAVREGLEQLNIQNRKDEVAAKGTIALEVIDQLADVSANGEIQFFCPIGSGALAAGCAIALKQAYGNRVKIIGAEPAEANDFSMLFHSQTVSATKAPMSVADSLRSPKVREEYQSTLMSMIDDVVELSEKEIVETMRLLKMHNQIVTEPSSAISVAAYLKTRDQVNLKTSANMVALLTAANVDTNVFKFLA